MSAFDPKRTLSDFELATQKRQRGQNLAPWASDRVADGTIVLASRLTVSQPQQRMAKEAFMNGLIYLIGLIVVIMFILSFLGLR